MNTDQNLLFGVLALELDYIDDRQFAEVCCAWAAYKERCLADLLVERRWIRAEERDEVQRLMERKVQRRQGDARQALSDAAGPQLRDVMHGPDWRPTWRAGFWPLALRIDHVLVNGDLCVAHAEVGESIGSDHRPVIARLQVRPRAVASVEPDPSVSGH